MEFNYLVVKNISNPDFWSGNRDVLEKCDMVAKCCKSGDLRHFLSGSREILELFVKYMYKRITKKKSIPRMLGEKINDKDFKVALDNAELISAAERINQITRAYHHDPERKDNETAEEFRARVKYEDEKEVPVHALEVLEKMSVFLPLAANVIDHKIPREHGKISLSLRDMYFEKSDSTERVLSADLEDVDSYDDYDRTWEIEGQGAIHYTGRTLILRKSYLGKVIVIKATNKKTGQVLTNKFGPIHKAHLLSDEKDATASTNPDATREPTGGSGTAQRRDSAQSASGRGTSSPVDEEKPKPPKPEAPKRKPLLTASFLEAELAKELLKTQDDYDAED